VAEVKTRQILAPSRPDALTVGSPPGIIGVVDVDGVDSISDVGDIPAPPTPPGDLHLEAWDRFRPLIRPVAAVALVLVAYHTSLRTLLDSLSLDTPLAHLALVPVISILLAFAARSLPAGPDIHDRQLDWIVGLPLVAGAVAANLLLPARLSTLFWLWRVDLLTMPFFVAGIVALLFGVRALWRLRFAVLFLFLAWPYPYTLLLDRWLDQFTRFTIDALKLVLHVVPIATALIGGDGSTFTVAHGAQDVQLSVASACSGANGLVGFLLVGVAFLVVVEGTRRAKVLWLATGALLVWVMNLLRILVIFLAARTWGERVAIDGFHPFVGLVVFNLAILVMVLVMGRFHLRLKIGARRTPPRSTEPSPDSGGPAPAPLAPPVVTAVLRQTYRPSWKGALGVVVAATLAISVLNGDLSSADIVATSLGSPRLADFQTSQERPAGWGLSFETEYTQYKRFFGSSSTWRRYVYANTSTASALGSTMPVIADIIETGNRASLVAYGIEACYKFHGFDISKQQSVDLGAGVVGGLLTWTDPTDKTTWTTLYWHWPIKTASGTRWERLTLLLQDADYAAFRSPPLDSSITRSFELSVSDALAGGKDSAISSRLGQARLFLVSFARELVTERAPAAA
jgi:exosortase/archaeosortase family protein